MINVRLALLAAFSLLLVSSSEAWATTAAGTAITNTSSISFSDGTSSFASQSNTLTIYVQNAPSLTVTSPAGQNITVDDTVVDTFTLMNTGNGAGNFGLAADASNAGTSSATLSGYVLNGASTGTCSVAMPCALSNLQTQLANLSATGMNGTITIGVEYQQSGTQVYGTTVQYSIAPTITYPAGTGTSAATSSTVTSSVFSDTLVSDTRLDIQVTSTPPPNGSASLAWQITVNNHGNYPAQDLQSVKSLLGSASNGIAFFITVPTFGGTALALAAQPSAPTLSGAGSGTTATVYYSTKTTGVPTSSATWSTTYSSNATYIAILLSGGSGGDELPSAPSGSTGTGHVTVPQVTFTFATVQPTGSGSGNAGALTLMANSAAGGLSWATGAVPMLGYALGGRTDAANASLLTTMEANTTPGTVGSEAWTGGISNQATNQAYASYSLDNGPFNNPDATGWYPGATGTPAADNAHDFTALSVPCTSNSSSSVNGLSCTVGTNIVIVNTVKNEGNATDTIQLTAQAPAGWTVQLYNATGCSAFNGTGCTQGSAITSQSSGGGSVQGTVSVGSQTSLNYEAVYNAVSNSTTPFAAYDTSITAAGQSGSGTGSDSNATHNDLIPGGAVKLVNGVTVTSTGCPAGESPSNAGACPGGTLRYTVQYNNVIPAAVASNLGTEPSFAYQACYSGAGSLVITDDGAANPSGAPSANNWATYTNGIAAAASDTTANTVFTYYPSASTTFSASQTKFTAQVGGSSYQLAPGGSGTITFSAVAK